MRMALLWVALAALMIASAAPIGADDDPLVDRMNSFAREYNVFADQFRVGIFDVKSARELSRRWKRVEHSEDWPK
jgi:hypothetical protein